MFKAGREEQRIRRPFTLEELSKLYQQAPDDFWRYMVLAGFFTGLRLGDLATMPIGAVDFSARTINVLTRKTGRSLHIPIATPLYALLCRLKAARNGAAPGDAWWPEQARLYEAQGAGPLSNDFYDLLLVKSGLAGLRTHQKAKKGRASKRKVNAISFHCFRHSYVSTLAALGQNQQIVKALAGHSSDEVNDLYTKLPPEILKQAVALLPDITKGAK
jgi:integrase